MATRRKRREELREKRKGNEQGKAQNKQEITGKRKTI